MKKSSIAFFVLIITALLMSCEQSQQGQTSSKEDSNSNKPKVYKIKGEEIVIRTGPGNDFDKLINQKATQSLGKTHYAQVDYTVEVVIEATEGEWSKIKVVNPDWLSNSHIGWIQTKHILMEGGNKVKNHEKLDPNSYEIFKTEHNSQVQNFHVLIKSEGFNKETIHDLINKFRTEHCKGNCNVNIYDSKSISELISKYPLEKKEYIELADHFVAMSSFDAPDLKTWYPFQDFQYKEYGGKNWKKEKIE